MSLSSEARKGYLFFAVLIIAAGILVFLNLRDRTDSADSLIGAVPKDAVAVLHVPNVPELGLKLVSVLKELGLEQRISAFEENIRRQLGFDPLDGDELYSRGLYSDGGVVVYSPPPGRFAVLMFRVRDPRLFENYIEEIFSARTGAVRGEDRDVDGIAVKIVETRGRPVAAWAYNGNIVSLTAGPDCAGRAASSFATDSGSIEDELWYRRGFSGKDAQLTGWVSKIGSRNMHPMLPELFDSMSIEVRVDQGLQIRTWGGIDAPRRNFLDPFKVSPDAESLVGLFDYESVIAGRFSMDLRKLWSMLDLGGLPPRMEELSAQMTARGMRIDRDIIPLFEGTFIADAKLAEKPNIGAIRTMDPRRLNPFLYIHTGIIAPLKDPEKALEMMPGIASGVARAFRARVETVEIDGHEAYEIHYRLGKGMTFGVVDKMLLITGGEDTYVKAMRRILDSREEIIIQDQQALKKISSEGAAAVFINVPNLVDSVEGLPAESFGGGPTGMMIRSMVRIFIGPVSRLGSVTADISVDDYGIVMNADVGIKETMADTDD